MNSILVLIFVLGNCLGRRLVSQIEINNLFQKFVRSELSGDGIMILTEVAEILRRPQHLSRKGIGRDSPNRMNYNCMICNTAFVSIHSAVRNDRPDSEVIDALALFCSMLGFEQYDVCRGLVSTNLPVIKYILRNTPEASPADFCGVLLTNTEGTTVCPFNETRFDWQVELPQLTRADNFIHNNEMKEPVKVAVISDVHIDTIYQVYGNAECGAPLCCRAGNVPEEDHTIRTGLRASFDESVVEVAGHLMLDIDAPKIARDNDVEKDHKMRLAGYWGDYGNCDMPVWAFEDLVHRIQEEHKDIDAIYYVGDSNDHNIWETGYGVVSGINRFAYNMMRSAFNEDVLIVPSVGCLDTEPKKQFAPNYVTDEGVNTTWLYENLAEQWKYLPQEAKTTFRDSGSYSLKVKPGLRVISLNNNVASVENWWVVHDPLDSKRQLEWLVEELASAAQAGEMVHIISHYPVGKSLLRTWNREYNRVINHFSSTIKGQFTGYTHADEFKIFYNVDGVPVNVAWSAGSGTPYSGFNPNYHIATFSPNTFELENLESYTYNLTAANLNPSERPKWYKLSDKKSFYLEDLSPGSMDKLLRRMVSKDKDLLQQYYTYSTRNSDAMEDCDEQCQMQMVCEAVTTSNNTKKCDQLKKLYFKSFHML